ncbi:MAG: hypothetical protein MZV63_40175 [Marinilabiliales bacterium]|nr:hypothetical protein [Marinilabiliales bacterium]
MRQGEGAEGRDDPAKLFTLRQRSTGATPSLPGTPLSVAVQTNDRGGAWSPDGNWGAFCPGGVGDEFLSPFSRRYLACAAGADWQDAPDSVRLCAHRGQHKLR